MDALQERGLPQVYEYTLALHKGEVEHAGKVHKFGKY
jgi:hypothetical protein